MVIIPKYMIRYRGRCIAPGAKVSVDDVTGQRLISGMIATAAGKKDKK